MLILHKLTRVINSGVRSDDQIWVHVDEYVQNNPLRSLSLYSRAHTHAADCVLWRKATGARPNQWDERERRAKQSFLLLRACDCSGATNGRKSFPINIYPSGKFYPFARSFVSYNGERRAAEWVLMWTIEVDSPCLRTAEKLYALFLSPLCLRRLSDMSSKKGLENNAQQSLLESSWNTHLMMIDVNKSCRPITLVYIVVEKMHRFLPKFFHVGCYTHGILFCTVFIYEYEYCFKGEII